MMTLPLALLVIAAVLAWLSWESRQGGASLLKEIHDTNTRLAEVCVHLASMSGGVEEIRIRDLEDAVERLPRKWEEVKRESAATEKRARYHVARVQKELEERGLTDPGIEVLRDQLQLLDGAGGEVEGLQPLPESVASVPEESQPESSDWEALASRRKFG